MTFENHLLDTNIISRILFPKHPNNKDISEWFLRFLIENEKNIYLPEIVAYEVRRGLWVKKLKNSDDRSLNRFEELSKHLTYLPINTNVFKIAEKLWAESRINGRPTASDDSLDADVLLAAQAIDIEASIITENIKHLQNYVKTYHWKNL